MVSPIFEDPFSPLTQKVVEEEEPLAKRPKVDSTHTHYSPAKTSTPIEAAPVVQEPMAPKPTFQPKEPISPIYMLGCGVAVVVNLTRMGRTYMQFTFKDARPCNIFKNQYVQLMDMLPSLTEAVEGKEVEEFECGHMRASVYNATDGDLEIKISSKTSHEMTINRRVYLAFVEAIPELDSYMKKCLTPKMRRHLEYN